MKRISAMLNIQCEEKYQDTAICLHDRLILNRLLKGDPPTSPFLFFKTRLTSWDAIVDVNILVNYYAAHYHCIICYHTSSLPTQAEALSVN